MYRKVTAATLAYYAMVVLALTQPAEGLSTGAVGLSRWRRPRGKALARNESVRRKNRVKLKVTAPSILMTGTRDESTALGDHSDLRLLPTECSRPWRENAPSEGSSVRGQPEKGMESFVSSRKFRKKCGHQRVI